MSVPTIHITPPLGGGLQIRSSKVNRGHDFRHNRGRQFGLEPRGHLPKIICWVHALQMNSYARHTHMKFISRGSRLEEPAKVNWDHAVGINWSADMPRVCNRRCCGEGAQQCHAMHMARFHNARAGFCIE
jgi:hypothetical protein